MKTTLKLLSLTISIFFLLNPYKTKAQCHIDDWTALKALYENTDGDNWINRIGWDVQIDNRVNPPANCNLQQLEGVDLDSQGRVKWLRLHSNQLNGSIPSEIGNLTNLSILNLFNNQLNGSVPSELGSLTNLVSLSLHSNKLTGNIPNEIGNLNSLSFLNLYNNNLSGNIPLELAGLSSLSELRLGKNNLNGGIPLQLGNLSNLTRLNLFNNLLSGNIPAELGNLNNLTALKIHNNDLNGCYPASLLSFCTQLTDPDFSGSAHISNGNNFDITWDDFCANGEGICEDDCPSNISNVYPGDLNNDGIVNNQDIGLSGLFLFEIGSQRATEHQNIDWNPYPAQDWCRQHLNNEDIKHFDCNGDGAITEDDRQAVEDNMGEMWSTPETVDPTETSDYQITLHPVEEINQNLLRINVALESVNGGDLILQGGHFTIDYGMQNQNIVNATMNFESVSWLGVRNLNLTESIQNFQATQTIEIGFTRTDTTDATGSGVIGELILQLENPAARLAETSNCMLNLQVKTIGMHDSEANNKPVENRMLQVNMCESTCENNWYINEETQFQNEYQSSNLIETEGFLIIGNEQQVEYQSNRVCLQSGFKVKAGASFRAGYGSCN